MKLKKNKASCQNNNNNNNNNHLLILYNKSGYIYCYTDTINFTIFSQLLTCKFLTSQNKIIKYETVTNHN